MTYIPISIWMFRNTVNHSNWFHTDNRFISQLIMVYGAKTKSQYFNYSNYKTQDAFSDHLCLVVSGGLIFRFKYQEPFWGQLKSVCKKQNRNCICIFSIGNDKSAQLQNIEHSNFKNILVRNKSLILDALKVAATDDL